MKILGLSVIVTIGLFAVDATVKYGDVQIQVNEEKAQSYKVDSNFTFNENEKICLLSKGQGRVYMIDTFGVEKVLRKSNKCIVFKSKVAKPKVVTLKIFSNEPYISGAGKGGTYFFYTKDITLLNYQDKKSIKIVPNMKTLRWTEPIELQILENNKIIKNIEYKNNSFLVPINILKKGQIIKVENIGRAGDEYMKSKVK